MQLKSSIDAVNSRIRDFVQRDSNCVELSRPAILAKSRIVGKFEEPTGDTASARRKAAWAKWIAFDEGIPENGILGPHWAKARLLIHSVLRGFTPGDLVFTNGSQVFPLGNHTSLACKLSEVWSITHDCFDLFAGLSYQHRALRHAVKKRFKSYCTKHRLSERSLNRYLWAKFRSNPDFAFRIYSFKLFLTVTFVDGNRWSTVPKNNLKDRAICLEPLCNMLVQRAIGLGIRRCLKNNLGIDLDHLADVHRGRISDPKVATIDLSDCSDAIGLRLVKYLLPLRVFNKISASRSDMTFGLDDNYHVIKKVSSMGNGFTFDLMTLILTALTRSFDPTSTVFGDDIICQNSVANDVVSNLKLAGFVVNLDKTNIESDYRESCGAHFIDGYGYVTAFDVKWLTSPLDLIVTCNKVAILANIYGQPFEALREEIWSCVPRSLLGATVSRLTVYAGRPPAYELDNFIRYGPMINVGPTKRLLRSLRAVQRHLHKPGAISVALAYENILDPPSEHLRADQWDVFFQFIHSGRRSRKFPRVVLKSTLVARVNEEQIGFVKALLP